MNEKRRSDEEIEIRLDDLLWYVLKGWKPMIVAMLIGAILLGGYKSYGNMKAAEITRDSMVEGYEAAHPDADMEQLDHSAKTIAEYQKKIKMQDNYASKSLLQQIDWTDVKVAKASYVVELTNGADYAKLVATAGAFVDRLSSDEMYKAAADALKTDPSYMDDLITVNYTIPQATNAVIDEKGGTGDAEPAIANADTFILTIIANAAEDETAKTMVDAAASIIDKVSADVASEVAPNKVKLIHVTQTVKRDTTIRDRQINDTIVSTQGYYDMIADAEKDLSDEELAYVKAKADILLDVEEEVKESSIISVKFIAIGLMAGLFIIALIRAAAYVISSKLTCPFETEDNYGIRTYMKNDDVKSVKGFDKVLFNARFGRSRVISGEEAAKIIATEAASLSDDRKIKKLLITGTYDKCCESDMAKKLADLLKKAGIETVMGEQIVYSPELIKNAADADAAVILEKLDESGKYMIREELRYMSDHGLPVMAAVLDVK